MLIAGAGSVASTNAIAATSSPSTPTSTSYTCVRNFYVSPTGSDSAAGTAQAAPWRTLQHADTAGQLRAGDCVNLANGVYTVQQTQALYHGGNANTATGYVVYRSINPQGAKLKAAGSGMQDVIDAYGDYMIFDGLELDGSNEGLVSNPVTNGSGIIGWGHHFQALNNLVHDFGGEGIGALFKDWYWIVGNTVYNNSQFNGYQTSGISIYEPAAVSFTPTAADNAAAYHITIKNNVAHDNAEWHVACATPNCHTDGNGVILDDFQLTQGANPYAAAGKVYPYKTLVQGNTIYHNGGRGVHVFQSDNVTVDSNVVYGDNLDTVNASTRGRGELSNANGTNNVWTNNKAAATTLTGGPEIYNTAVVDAVWAGATTVTWTNNANIDTRTGGKSYQIDNAARAAAFPLNNPLGAPL
jgi:serralysin